MSDLHFFDPHQTVGICERKLPHWSQAGVVCFITFRTNDSIPAEVLRRWRAERSQWLMRHGISQQTDNWRQQLEQIDVNARKEFFQYFSQRWRDELDTCRGACLLKRPEMAVEVEQSLLRFDGDRYEMFNFVVMPNHVHLLAAFAEEDSMLKQCTSWKHFTARQINTKCGRSGSFWQQDGFDHLVRSAEQFEHFRRYIADNPRKAGLQSGEFIHYSKKLSQVDGSRVRDAEQ